MPVTRVRQTWPWLATSQVPPADYADHSINLKSSSIRVCQAFQWNDVQSQILRMFQHVPAPRNIQMNSIFHWISLFFQVHPQNGIISKLHRSTILYEESILSSYCSTSLRKKLKKIMTARSSFNNERRRSLVLFYIIKIEIFPVSEKHNRVNRKVERVKPVVTF